MFWSTSWWPWPRSTRWSLTTSFPRGNEMERLSEDELFTPPMTFMGPPYGRPGPRNQAASLGIPFDCGTTMRIGARGGPDSVRQQSALMRRFNPTHADFDPVAALGLVDCGNVRLTPSKIVDAFERTEQAVDRIVQAGAIPITIGGDGSDDAVDRLLGALEGVDD